MTRTRLRSWSSVVLAVLGCLLAVVSLVAVWARNQVLDTDRYLTSVSPLASDPVIQDEVAAKVAAAIDQQLDPESVARRFLPRRAAPLAAPMAAAVEALVQDTTTKFVRSDAFPTLWVGLNRAGHQELVRVLTGSGTVTGSEAVSIRSGRLTLDLSPVVEAVRQRLATAGLKVVAAMPPITLVVDVADASSLEKARTAVTWLKRLAIALPVVSLLLLGGAVALARRRRRAGLLVLMGFVVAMLAARVLIHAGSGIAASHVPASAASPDAVHAYYHHLTSLLRRGATLLGVLGAVVALVVIAAGRVRGLIGGDAVADPALVLGLLADLTPFLGAILLLTVVHSAVGAVLLVLATGVVWVVLRRLQAAPGEPAAVA